MDTWLKRGHVHSQKPGVSSRARDCEGGVVRPEGTLKMQSPWEAGFPQEASLAALEPAPSVPKEISCLELGDKLIIPGRVKELGALLDPRKDH